MANGPSLPDLRRDPVLTEGSALARKLGEAALHLAWRVAQPGARTFLVGERAAPITRLAYTADDGWVADLFRIPPAVGGHGAPVLMAHGLGASHRVFALQPERCLARTLSAAGYTVYLLEHRGDRSATPPAGARAFSVDDIAMRDLSAALEVVAADSGYSRAIVIGHGLGAQAIYLALAMQAGENIAAVVTLSAAVLFARTASVARTAGIIAALAPREWTLPARRLQTVLTPFLSEGDAFGSPGSAACVLRGHLRYASADLHGGVLSQIARWVAEGALTDATGRLDVVAALPRMASLVIEGDADPTCPIGAAKPAADAMGSVVAALDGGWGYLDTLYGERAPAACFPQILTFCDQMRRRTE